MLASGSGSHKNETTQANEAFKRLVSCTTAVQRASSDDSISIAVKLGISEPSCCWIETALCNLSKFGPFTEAARSHITSETVPALCDLIKALAFNPALLTSGACSGSSISAVVNALRQAVRLPSVLNSCLDHNGGAILSDVAILARELVSSRLAHAAPDTIEKLLRTLKCLIVSAKAQDVALHNGGAADAIYDAIIVNGATTSHWLSTRLATGPTIAIHEIANEIFGMLADSAGTTTFTTWWTAKPRATDFAKCYLTPSLDSGGLDDLPASAWDDCGIYASLGPMCVQV